MNYTSIEQSKKLLELGLNPETADMFYIEGSGAIGVNVPFVKESERNGIPCWSVGALLTVMPKWDDYKPYIGKDECFYVNEDNEIYHRETGTTLEAVYNMVVWLLENGYIEKVKE